MSQAQMTVADPDALYQSFDKNLYRIDGDAEENAIMQMMQADPGANNSANVTVSASDLGSGVDTSTTVQTTGSMQAGKKTYDNTASGYILGVDPSVGIAKFYIGNTTAYLNWDGSTLMIKGSISASSIDIPDTSTAASFHVDSSGNTWWGATTLANSTASVTAAGVITGIGISSLNKIAVTNFESSTRFVNTSTAGVTIAPAYGNQGVTLTTTATASRYCRVLWFLNNAFTNSPTFTCTLTANALNAATGDSAAFIGLGDPGVSETGYTTTNKSQIGIIIRKSSGVVNVGSQTNDGNADGGLGANFTTISDSDSLEIFIKTTGATSAKWYYRKNGGAIALGDTQTSRIPTSNSEQNLHFSATNMGTTADFNIILQCSAYEH